MPDRCYVPVATPAGPWRLDGDEAHHLARVRRAAVGQVVHVLDGASDAAQEAVVEAIERGPVVVLRPTGRSIAGAVPRREVVLGVAPPKGDRLDWLVEKAVEVGVAALQLLRTTRGEVDPRSAKLDRLRRRVVEASKQCGRNRLMALRDPIGWDDWIASAGPGTKLVAHPGGRAVASWPLVPGEPAALAVGPEGGLTVAEVEAAEAAGWTTVDLGPTILRIETAALVATAFAANLAPPPSPANRGGAT